jgi:C-terminal novel E3 ligase, LRR-interacting/Leucine rich repeat
MVNVYRNSSNVLAILNAEKPTNWEERVLYSAINPLKTKLERKIARIALLILAAVFSLVTVCIGSILVRKLTTTFNIYRKRIDDRILHSRERVFQIDNVEYTHYKKNERRALVNSLTMFLSTNPSVFQSVKDKILACYDNRFNSLDLSYCNLEVIPPQIFTYLYRHIKNLELSGNRIQNIPTQINSLTKLEYLYIQNNAIEAMSQSIESFPNLRSMNFSNNRIREISRDIIYANHEWITTPPMILLHDNPLSDLCIREIRTSQDNNREAGNGNWPSFFYTETPRPVPPSQSHTFPYQNRVAPSSISNLENHIAQWKKCLPANSNFKNFSFASFGKNKNLDVRERDRRLLILEKFLEKLLTTHHFIMSKDSEKNLFAEQLFVYLSCMLENADFQDLAIVICNDGAESCTDGCSTSFNELYILWLLHFKTANCTSLDLAFLALGLKRLAIIKKFTAAKDPKRHPIFTDPIETELCIQIELKKKFKLPLIIETMQFRGISGVSSDKLQEITKEIITKTTNKQDVINALMDAKFWKESLLKANEDLYQKIVENYMEQSGFTGDEMKGGLNEKLDKQYREDTEAWYEQNKEHFKISNK